MSWPVQCEDYRDWIPFTPAAAAPAFGVMESTGTTTLDGQIVIQTKAYVPGDPRKTIWVNGPQNVAAGAYGRCTRAIDVPTVALVNTSPTAPRIGGLGRLGLTERRQLDPDLLGTRWALLAGRLCAI